MTASAQHGDKVCFTVWIFNTCSSCCDVAGVNTTLFIGDPDGPGGSAAAVSYPITSGAYLERGAVFICPSDDSRCVTAGNCTIPGQIGYEYIVDHADEHGDTGGLCPPTPVAGIGQVSAYASLTGTACGLVPAIWTGCRALAFDVPHGACCDQCNGECDDAATENECLDPHIFTPGAFCADACTPPDCNDGNVCTDDRCDSAMGCVYIPTESPGSIDADGDVDLHDFYAFEECMVEGVGTLPPECEKIDLVPDGIIDLLDYRVFQAMLTGPCP